MIPDLPFAINLPSAENLGRFLISVLAVAGAAFVGGLLAGVITQVLARMLTASSVPRRPLLVIRALGAVAAGVLAAMILFNSGGGGGWGWGGGSGNGVGTGRGNGDQANQDKSSKDGPHQPDKPLPKNGESNKTPLLRIEVIVDPSEKDKDRTYRIEGEKELRTLDEVEKVIDQQRKDKPELQTAVIVLYANSPSRHTTVVKDLERRIETKGLKPDILLLKERAP